MIVTVEKKISLRREELVKPFVKWAGGKTQLINELAPLVPEKYSRYFEPFLGSGALFFHLLPQNAYLNDSNDDLINAYNVIKSDVESLILELKHHKNDATYFYEMRAKQQNSLSPIERASRLIYLNRTCFNGLYRVNQTGQFNTPFGRYKNPTLCNAENLRRVSSALKGAKLTCSNYSVAVSGAKKSDFVYFDPPYIPISAYSDFKRYTKESFYLEDHEKLAELFRELDERGCYVMLSNSYHPLIAKLYRGFNTRYVEARRLINRIASKRGNVTEVIVRNY